MSLQKAATLAFIVVATLSVPLCLCLQAQVPTTFSEANADATPAESYVWTYRRVPLGVELSGKGLPMILVTHDQSGPQATIDGKPVKVVFIGGPELPPVAMVLQGEEETLNINFDDPIAITGVMSGENISTKENIISYRGMDFKMNIGKTVSLASLQAGDVPVPVRRFAAYMLVMMSVVLSAHGQ